MSRFLRYCYRAPLLLLHIVIGLPLILVLMGAWAARFRVGGERLDHWIAGAWSRILLRIFGLPRGQARHNLPGMLQLVHFEDRGRLQDAQRRLHAGEAELDIEYRIVRPDGETRFVRELGPQIGDLFTQVLLTCDRLGFNREREPLDATQFRPAALRASITGPCNMDFRTEYRRLVEVKLAALGVDISTLTPTAR